ncbi:MAG: MerC domain-containing protein [Bdellovibrionota bacterium]
MKAFAEVPDQTQDQLDRAAMLLSMICLVHCTVLPLALALLPALSSTFLPHALDNDLFHILFAFILFGVGGIAFVQGFRRHSLWVPLLAGIFGTACLFVGAFNPGSLLPDYGEHAVTVVGTVILLFGHARNRAGLRHRAHAGPCAHPGH